MKPGLPQLTVVVESGLADMGVAPRRKLQLVRRGALLSQTERMLIKASNHAGYIEGAERQEEYFPQKALYPLRGGS